MLRPAAAATGIGFKLRFRWYEANIAAIMKQLRILGVKIDGMLSIGCVYREVIAYFDGFGLDHDLVYGLCSLLITEKKLRHRVNKVRKTKGCHNPLRILL